MSNPHRQRQERMEELSRLADVSEERVEHLLAAALLLENDLTVSSGCKAEFISVAQTLRANAGALHADAQELRSRVAELSRHLQAGAR